MAHASTIEHALQRLGAALDMVEGAVEDYVEKIEHASGLESELHRLGTDRSRLAQSLDASEARAAKLDEANREVSHRLVAAMESIRDVLSRGVG
jgi:hypothetical protein